MEDEWIGKAVSIECDEKLGIFQGIIKNISETQITIVRAFRNGVPLRKQYAEVTLRSPDILKIELIPAYNGQSTVTPNIGSKPTPVKQPKFADVLNGVPSFSPFVFGNTVPKTPNPSTPNQSQLQLSGTPQSATSILSNGVSNLRISSNFASTPSSSLASSGTQPTLQQQQVNDTNCKSPSDNSTSNSVAQFFGNLIPSKVEVRMGATLPYADPASASTSTAASCNAESYGSSASASSKPIDIVNSRDTYGRQSNISGNSSNGNGTYGKMRNGNGNGSNGGSAKKQQRRKIYRENSFKQKQTFGTSVDDPLIHEDFDFEGNLALFDKQAIWDVIEAEQKPDLLRQADSIQKKKYRHDENILVSEPLELRQIETMFDRSSDFVTDEGLIIPTIPIFARSKIELNAEKGGLSIQRQMDILARGATDLTISLLGGARRLTPNNCHQWPKIVIICEQSKNYRASNIGAATGRQLASHGLKVLLYLEEDATIEQKNNEISLFKATGNTVVYSVNALPAPDLVILSTNAINLSPDVKKWLSENRASVLAIDPPPSGIKEVPIKYAILPILPLNGISSNTCGKLYLCNLGIPDKFFRDAGIKYKSPFGHKFVIPIHSKD